ncbi:hypothetical protein AB2M62_14960 [Sphingomonas sp. MMS12-HWE2-04]|uniref:hypothetical protein n=1 Tax=Sphingomonas sp. MMS12-HWE2-04 TaxID=3234199 RepID=UPI0038504377
MLGMEIAIVASAAETITQAERAAILDAARTPVSEALGKPVLFKVDALHHAGDWAFLRAEMQERGGAPVDYAGTSKAEAAREGMVSRVYAALLRRTGGRWKVVECAIGPTDVAWAGWAQHHGAPAAIFG